MTLFSPFDLASSIQPSQYLTCCISYTCCLLGHHQHNTPVELEGPRKLNPVSVTLIYTTTGDHLEKAFIHLESSILRCTSWDSTCFSAKVLDWGQISKDQCEVLSGTLWEI